jgi:hypothetical protein
VIVAHACSTRPTTPREPGSHELEPDACHRRPSGLVTFGAERPKDNQCFPHGIDVIVTVTRIGETARLAAKQRPRSRSSP